MNVILFAVAGDLDSLFVHAADCRHCQDGAIRPAPLPSVTADDVRNNLCNHFYNFRSISQCLTPTSSSPGGLWKTSEYNTVLLLLLQHKKQFYGIWFRQGRLTYS